MRWLAGTFCLALAAFVASVAGPAMGRLVLLAGIVLIISLRAARGRKGHQGMGPVSSCGLDTP